MPCWDSHCCLPPPQDHFSVCSSQTPDSGFEQVFFVGCTELLDLHIAHAEDVVEGRDGGAYQCTFQKSLCNVKIVEYGVFWVPLTALRMLAHDSWGSGGGQVNSPIWDVILKKRGKRRRKKGNRGRKGLKKIWHAPWSDLPHSPKPDLWIPPCMFSGTFNHYLPNQDKSNSLNKK